MIRQSLHLKAKLGDDCGIVCDVVGELVALKCDVCMHVSHKRHTYPVQQPGTYEILHPNAVSEMDICFNTGLALPPGPTFHPTL